MQEETQQEQIIPVGYCQCGCGQKTNLARCTDANKGWVKGEPLKYLFAHNAVINGRAQTARSIGRRSRSSHGYVVVKTGKDKRQYEHVMVAEKVLGRPLRYFGVGHPNNEVVHHVHGNKKDSKNLVICTHSYHTALHVRLEASPEWPEFKQRAKHPNGTSRVGKSGFKGVYFDRKSGRWEATCGSRKNRNKKYIGTFADPISAAMAYDTAVLELHGPNWITNKSLGLLP